MIVGTAGHIDHGKSTLIRALTGVDTDRLPEEKARGISIDLGYAYVNEPGLSLGFIDVPGHERFVHTMLAGATGIDYALLVVAADDGVMPQTREHLAILELLGVQRGRVALTKTDRVDSARVQAVQAEVAALLAGGPLAGITIDPVSAPTGLGIAALRAALCEAAQALPPAAVQQGFRLAVDRSFVLGGLGTVVTGTVFSGQVQVGDQLITAPGGVPVRVRSLHAQNQVASTASTGMRCALQLAGIQKDQVARGDWIVAATTPASTSRFDARIRLLPGEARVLRHWTPVHLHLGAAHCTARVALLQEADVQPGELALVQIVADCPLACWHGDRFVLRDQSAQRTLAGGQVLDPVGWPRHRRAPHRLAMLQALQSPDVQSRVAALLALTPSGIDVQALEQSFNQPLGAVLAGLSQVQRVEQGGRPLAFSTARWQQLSDLLVDAVGQFHVQFPGELGPAPARLKRIACPALAEAAFAACLQALLQDGALARSGAWVHLPGHRVQLSAQQQVLADKVQPLIHAGAYDPPWARDLAAAFSVPEDQMRGLLLAMTRQGRLFQVVKDLFYTSPNVHQLAQVARSLEARQGAIRAADFRDVTGLGRKRAIQILEFFDRVGYTRRVHDDHRLRGDSLFAPEELSPGS